MIHFQKCSLILILTSQVYVDKFNGKYLKFELLSFDTLLVPCVAMAAAATAELVASDFCLERGCSIFLHSLVSLVPSRTHCHYSGTHYCGGLQSAVFSTALLHKRAIN